MSEITKSKVLDLDELFGQARAVKVKWAGREYELLRMEAISPKQSVKFQKFQVKASVLQSQGELSDENAEQISDLVDEMLRMLCAELPLAEIPFMAKMRILTFYIEETQGKKSLEAALSAVTGATSSHA